MSNPESLSDPAPEVFGRCYKPSELANRFKVFTERMVREDRAVRQGDKVYMTEAGLVVKFDKDKDGENVSRVAVNAKHPDPTFYQIIFTRGLKYMATYAKDESNATFLVGIRENDLERTISNTFSRDYLEPGDTEVNEFLHDLTTAIHDFSNEPDDIE